jgi:hypothetical protein
MIRRFTLALAACLWASLAFGQANGDSQWNTPGNSVVGGALQMCVNTAGKAVPCQTAVAGAAGFPNGATPVANGATGTTAGATATLAAAAGKFTYICGYSYSAGSATTAIVSTVTATFAGTLTNTVGAPATAAGVTGNTIVVPITPCQPGSTVNTSITVVGSALGAGGAGQAVNAWGYQL